MDPRLKHPFHALIAGPTCCGKTQFVKRLLEAGEEMIHGAHQKRSDGVMEFINRPMMKCKGLFLTSHLSKEFQLIWNL